jgi:hypothetical protein
MLNIALNHHVDTHSGDNNHDNPWKLVIDGYLNDFMLFYFDFVSRHINWSIGYESLDDELPALVHDEELGKCYADKLIKVTTLDGETSVVYIYVETNGRTNKDFAQRMFTCNYRIYDKFGTYPVLLAVLADNDANWKPVQYYRQRWGCGIIFTFPVVKLTDYHGQLAELLDSNNPFAILTAAHFLTRCTRHDMTERLQTKIKLAKLLYQKSWDKQELLEFFSVIDWLMRLPDVLTVQFHQHIASYEREKEMRYVTSIEQIGFENGMQQGIEAGKLSGLVEAVQGLIRRKFPDVDEEKWMPILHAADKNTLHHYLSQVLDASNVDDIFGAKH